MGARETDSMFTHRIFFFLIKSVYLAIVGSLQTQALTDVTITDLLLASYVAAAGTSPSMEEETGRHVCLSRGHRAGRCRCWDSTPEG